MSSISRWQRTASAQRFSDSVLKSMRWLLQWFGGASQPKNPRCHVEDAGHSSESAGLGLVLDSDALGKRRVRVSRPRPSQRVAYFHICERIRRKRSLVVRGESTRPRTVRPPLPTQEESFKQWRKENRVAQRSCKSRVQRARHRADTETAMMQYRVFANDVRRKFNDMRRMPYRAKNWFTIPCECRHRNRRQCVGEFDAKGVLCAVSMVSRRVLVLKRRFRRLFRTIRCRECVMYQIVIQTGCHSRVRKADMSEFRFRPTEVQVDDDLSEMGLEYDWETGVLSRETLAADYGQDPGTYYAKTLDQSHPIARRL
jgi:hypothetical protein